MKLDRAVLRVRASLFLLDGGRIGPTAPSVVSDSAAYGSITSAPHESSLANALRA